MMQCVAMTSSSMPAAATPVGDYCLDGATRRQPEASAAADKNGSGSSSGLSELELLRRIYDEICDIRQRHADIMTDTAARKAENQRLLEEQTTKMERLEVEHRETGRRMKDSTVAASSDHEMAALSTKYQAERDELDAIRRAIDDLEFQMFEADAHFDEEKEMIQQQLMDKQQALLDVEAQHTVYGASSELNTALTLPVVVIETPPNSDSIASKHVTPSDHSDDVTSGQPKIIPRVDAQVAVEVESSVEQKDSVHDDDSGGQHVDISFTVLHPIDADENGSHGNDESPSSSSPRFIRSLPSPLQPLPDCLLPFPTDIRQQQQQQPISGHDVSGTGSCRMQQLLSDENGCDSEDGWSTGSSERMLEHQQHQHRDLVVMQTEINERISWMKKQLAAAEAEKARLIRQQAESDDEGLRDETQKRLQVRRRLDVEFDVKTQRHSNEVATCSVDMDDDDVTNNNARLSVSSDDRTVVKRNTRRPVQCRQSRPLTRYLPVRDQPLDLLRFVEEQAGHSVERCSADVIVTSQSARGFLVKMGGRIRTWRRRWFVFDRSRRHLAYYVDQSERRRPRGVIDFRIIEDVYVFDQVSSVKSPAPELTFCVKTTKRTYYIVAPNAEVRQLWMDIVFTGAEGYRQFD